MNLTEVHAEALISHDNLFVRKFTLTQVLNVPPLLLLIELEDLENKGQVYSDFLEDQG